jgi:hypothetical protein
MNLNHTPDSADYIEYSNEPDFKYQGGPDTRRPVNPGLAGVLVDMAFIVRCGQKNIIYTRAPPALDYLAGIFPAVDFHIYDDCDIVRSNIHTYTQTLENCDAHAAYNFYHDSLINQSRWLGITQPALFKYSQITMRPARLMRVPFGEQRDGLALVCQPGNKAARPVYRAYYAPAHRCTIDDVDRYASSAVARVAMDNCYDCYAARDILGQYLEYSGQPNTAGARYAMFAGVPRDSTR